MQSAPHPSLSPTPVASTAEEVVTDLSGMSRPREADRLTINKEFESFDAFIHEYVTNISRTGVFIKSKSPLSIGTKVNLRFTLIMDDIETIEGEGEVVRVENDPAGMGILFTTLHPESRALVERLLEGHAATAEGELESCEKAPFASTEE
ncbi:MAG: hypothetical protein NVS3B20_00820 [Polyangiales bacterium]